MIGSDLEIILSLLGTWSVNPKPTDKRNKKMLKIGHKMTKIDPKNVENQANLPQNFQKPHKLLQKSYLQQKARDLPSKSYCWSQTYLAPRA